MLEFTQSRNALDQIEYHHDTDKYRYVVSKRNEKYWFIDVWTLVRVGKLDPPLMIRGAHVDQMAVKLRRDAYEEVEFDIKTRR